MPCHDNGNNNNNDNNNNDGDDNDDDKNVYLASRHQVCAMILV